MTEFVDKLKKVCKKCQPSSIRLYLQNIKRIYRLLEPDAEKLPKTGAWLKKDKLFTELKKIPINKRRALSLAGLKATYAYDFSEKASKRFYDLMIADSEAYQKNRNKNVATDKEKKLLPKDGIKSLKKAAVTYKRRIKFLLEKDPSLKGLYKYQMYIALKLYTQIPFRNTFSDIQISDKDIKGNYLLTKKGNMKFVMRKYKNSDRLGEREVDINRANTIAIRKFLKYRDGLVKHKYLFSTLHGEKMSRASFGKALQKTYSSVLGKNIGSRLIRIIHANSEKEAIMKTKELTNKLLHGPKQTSQYVKE